MIVAVINYGMGNTFSVKQTIEKMGHKVFIANKPNELRKANKIILPGVGAFSKAMNNLNIAGWTEVLNKLVKEEKVPLLGICLGMQLLAKSSNEITNTPGLSFINGDIVRLNELGCKNKLPHVGWNNVKLKKDPIVDGITQNSDFYFVHSYAFKSLDRETIIGTTNYGIDIISIIKHENIIGTQFHPEKSSSSGEALLKNFLKKS